MVTLQCGGLVAVSLNLSHHKQVQLMAYLSEGGSEGLVVLFYWEEHGAGCLWSKVTATAPANKILDQIVLVIQFPHHCSHLVHL